MGQSDPFRAGPPPDARHAPDAAPRPSPQAVPETDPAAFPASEVDPTAFPASAVDPDPEWTEYVAWVDQEIAAGRAQEPGPEIWDPEAHSPGAAPVRPG